MYYGGGFARLRADGLFDDNIFNRLITDKFYGDRPEDIEDIMKGILLYNSKSLIGCGGGVAIFVSYIGIFSLFK